MNFKKKPIRLRGRKLHELYMRVYARDKGKCVVCGKGVPVGVPPHHIVYRSRGGEDVMENLVTLCYNCHRAIHDGKIAPNFDFLKKHDPNHSEKK